jgi:UDP-GlcNAc3NAcA epimerase
MEMLVLERHAQLIFTDSGGMQKEAFFQGTPCITLREETEWTETVEAGWNKLAGTETQRIVQAASEPFAKQSIMDFGDGKSAKHIIDILCQNGY